jgi:hypothetical protein
MALIGRGAGDGIGARARAGLARICLRAGIAIIARRAVGNVGIGARAGCGVASSSNVALIKRRTRNGIGTTTRAIGASIRLGTGISVITRGARGSDRIGTDAACWIACASDVALIGRGTGDGIGARASTGLARICLCTGIAIIAGCAVCRCWIGADASRGIAGTNNVALIGRGAGDGIGARARAGLARICLRAGIAIVAGGSVGHEPIGGTNAAASRTRFGGVALTG